MPPLRPRREFVMAGCQHLLRREGPFGSRPVRNPTLWRLVDGRSLDTGTGRIINEGRRRSRPVTEINPPVLTRSNLADRRPVSLGFQRVVARPSRPRKLSTVSKRRQTIGQ